MKRELVRDNLQNANNPSDNVRPWDENHPRNWVVDPLVTRLEAIESRLDAIECVMAEKLGAEVGRNKTEGESKNTTKKRGPSNTIPLEQLLIRRDGLIGFLEFYWPVLSQLFNRPQHGNAITQALERCAHSPNFSLAPTAELLLKHSTTLLRVLRSPEYRGDPRFVANAMAGIPEYSWSTSLKKCRKYPSSKAIGETALRDYVRRECRSVFPKLLNAKTAADVTRIVSAVHTDDRELSWLFARPEHLLQVLESGCPRKRR